MNRTKMPFYILVSLLMFAGIGLTWHRHVTFQVPFVPASKQTVWSLEARVEFEGKNTPAIISLAVPESQTGYEVLSEFTASPGYGLAFARKNDVRRAEWSTRNAAGNQILYYRADIVKNPDFIAEQSAPDITQHRLLLGTGPHITVARTLLNQARQRSADAFTLTRELIREFNQSPEAVYLLSLHGSRQEWLQALLQSEGIATRIVAVLLLEDGRRRSELVDYLQIFINDTSYVLVDPLDAEESAEQPVFMWEYRSQSVLDVVGGKSSQVSFSVIEQNVPAGEIVSQRKATFADIMDFSIHMLPLSEQALFKGILLVPIGVLIVCLMRILVGIRTAGTFMPVLIAIAFIQTSLVTGLVGFLLIVGVGLLIRGYLSQLNLLLVARISTVIISVIILIAVLAVVAYELGLSEGLKISFFPMIILSWTIERMSILWEEEGGQEVIVQVGGSLFTAVITYALMMNDYVQHLTFNFLGLQLVIMALVLLLGTYTGYRLFELHRFYALVKRSDQPE